jgi:hypothetical protein
VLQDDVASDAAAQRRDHRQSSHADQVVVVALVAHRSQGSTQRADEDAGEIDGTKERVDMQERGGMEVRLQSEDRRGRGV